MIRIVLVVLEKIVYIVLSGCADFERSEKSCISFLSPRDPVIPSEARKLLTRETQRLSTQRGNFLQESRCICRRSEETSYKRVDAFVDAARKLLTRESMHLSTQRGNFLQESRCICRRSEETSYKRVDAFVDAAKKLLTVEKVIRPTKELGNCSSWLVFLL